MVHENFALTVPVARSARLIQSVVIMKAVGSIFVSAPAMALHVASTSSAKMESVSIFVMTLDARDMNNVFEDSASLVIVSRGHARQTGFVSTMCVGATYAMRLPVSPTPKDDIACVKEADVS